MAGLGTERGAEQLPASMVDKACRRAVAFVATVQDRQGTQAIAHGWGEAEARHRVAATLGRARLRWHWLWWTKRETERGQCIDARGEADGGWREAASSSARELRPTGVEAGREGATRWRFRAGRRRGARRDADRALCMMLFWTAMYGRLPLVLGLGWSVKSCRP
jgi:hypothetical protein